MKGVCGLRLSKCLGESCTKELGRSHDCSTVFQQRNIMQITRWRGERPGDERWCQRPDPATDVRSAGDGVPGRLGRQSRDREPDALLELRLWRQADHLSCEQ